jgi:hypothetical protein
MSNAGLELIAFLQSHGPAVSTALVKHMGMSGIGVDAAKKRISREVAGRSIQRTRGIELPHRESFLFLKEQFKSPQFVEKLWVEHAKAGSIVAIALHSLHSRGGLIPNGHFAGVSGSPWRVKKQVSYERVREFLLRYGLAEQRYHEEHGECLQLGSGVPIGVPNSPSRMKARMVAENITIGHLTRWLSQMGMIGYESAKIRSGQTQPEFGQFSWDLTAPSYVHPFVLRIPGADPTPGFVVADVSIGGELSLPQVQHFLRKCEVIRHQKKQRPFLSMLVANHFSGDAFKELRRTGCMPVTLQNLLGEKLAEALNGLIMMLTNAAQVVASKPEAIYDLFSKLSSIEGAAANLRGPLFELVVAHCVSQKEGGLIEIQKAIREPGNQSLTDIDVLRLKIKQEVTAYECKGHFGDVEIGLQEVQKWFKTTIPRIRNYFFDQDQYRDLSHRFEFWTTGKFHLDALKFLHSVKATKKFTVDWKDGDDVIQYASEAKAGNLCQLLKEQYVRHPITKITSNAAHPRGTVQQRSSERDLSEWANQEINSIASSS